MDFDMIDIQTYENFQAASACDKLFEQTWQVNNGYFRNRDTERLKLGC